MSTKEWGSVSQALTEAGGHWSDTIVWKKDRFVMGRADYQRQYEPIWFGWREGAKHHWCGDRDQGDVWEIARPSESEAHPTMKPLPLVERAINNSSKPGDIVLDLFLGSGSTLIAAERTGRVCYGTEIDEHYGEVRELCRQGGLVPGVFVIARDARGSLVHVRRRDDGECVGCIEVGLYEVVRGLILAETKETTAARDRFRGGKRWLS